MEGLNREAIKAPIYSASLTLALPPQTVRLPLKVPESLFAGGHVNEGRKLYRRKAAELAELAKKDPAKHATHSGDTFEGSLVLFEGRAFSMASAVNRTVRPLVRLLLAI